MYETTEMRTVLANLLAEEMRKNPDVVIVDSDLARAHNTLPMKQEFPDRALDVGIAECNMASVAAGLASYGFKPFIYSFAPFASRRICDQIAISIVYAEQNVKIVGSDPCLAAEMNGATHMAVEDVGVLRSLPGMVIFEPVDGDQLAAAFPAIMAYEGPMFIRLFRKVPPATIFADPDYKFDLFKADLLKEGDEIEVYILGVDAENEKISLGMKQLTPNPWSQAKDKYPEGCVIPAKVMRTTDFGAFLEVEPGVEGLVHISQLANRHVEKTEDVVKPGDVVEVKVISVDPEAKRMSLSIKATQPEEAPAEAPVEEEAPAAE